ncbi:MAG: hypothetical protein H7Z17_13840 [Fuerstia sp.]|nr:hypothetical protein [Fuerstiella sp.]
MAGPQGPAEAAGQLTETIADMYMITFSSLCANSAIDFLRDLSAGKLLCELACAAQLLRRLRFSATNALIPSKAAYGDHEARLFPKGVVTRIDGCFASLRPHSRIQSHNCYAV